MTYSRGRRHLVVTSSVLLSGCAAGLSTSQPAHVPERGHSQMEAGVDLSFSTGTVRKLVRAAQALEQAAQSRTLVPAEERLILAGAAELAINPPAVIPHLGFAASPFDRWELGLRFASSGLRFGVRRQLLVQEENRLDLTVGFGGGIGVFTPPIDQALKAVSVQSFSRLNFDLPIVFGQHGLWYRWWAGPRLFYSRVSTDLTLTEPGLPPVTAAVSGHAFYLGGIAGVAFGYERIFVGPEVAIVGLIGGAQMDVLGTHVETSLDALVVYPAFAIMGEF